ncbi:PRTRC system protein B (plasmid) [Ahniella affigens]|uniref:PRTRC system protein B n=1 Tax=Ahniella affigens TaxID=2021234 RepID=A0A2P1PZH0_9GAMM|nr:PRTRC system protein B [Ahniella affigens]AVQ00249.1 PRTRC system protein B [Ahniella affigens]
MPTSRSKSRSLLIDVDHRSALRHRADEIKTTHALFFHTIRDKLALVTAHTVTPDHRDAPVVGPGRTLTHQDEVEIIRILSGRRPQGPIAVYPDSLLFRDEEVVCWWLPPTRRAMHLMTHNGGLQHVDAQWPSLVALVRNRELFLAAVAGTNRPTGNTALFHAPIGNVDGMGRVCTGSARLPLAGDVADIDGWSSVVFDTAFTHVNHNGTLKAGSSKSKKGKRSEKLHADAEFWMDKTIYGNGIPDDWLNPLCANLGNWLNYMTSRHEQTGDRRR